VFQFFNLFNFSMTLKQKIHAYYLQQVNDKIDAFRDMISALTEDASNDAKGSAGDKHETALSMMHIEQERLNHKLSEFLEQKVVLDKIDPDAQHTIVSLGSLIKSDKLYLFVSTALPKIAIDGIQVIALSTQSPLGQMIMGMKVGDEFKFGSINYIIEEIS
jgi:transcription elongation GreA/GreB family factor